MFESDRLRVLDLTGLLAGQLAARTLGDAGASVVRIDLLSGNPLEAFAADPSRRHLASLASVGKTLVTVDLAERSASEQAARLIEQADVVFLSHDTIPEMRSLADAFARDDAVVCDVGIADDLELPISDDPVAQDAFVQALAGTAQANGDPEGAPIPSAVGLTHSLTACHAAIAVLAASIDSQSAGCGVRVSICMRDVAASMALEHHALASDTGGRLPAGRQGNHSDGDTLGVYRGPSADYVIEVWGEGEDGMWARLAYAMDRSDLVTDPRFSTDRERVLRMPEIVELVEGWLRRHSDDEVERRLLAAKFTFGRVLRSEETRQLPQLLGRGLQTSDADRSLEACLPMSGLGRAPGLRRGLDITDERVRIPRTDRFPEGLTAPPSHAFRPLARWKVVEFGAAIAGPMATRILADLGATVLKIESPAGDMMRSYRPPTYDGVAILHSSLQANEALL